MTVSCVAVTCDTLESVTDYQSTIDLSNLNRSVFTDCPEALNADNYNASQISVIAQQALNVSVHCILIVLRTIASILYFVLSICMSCMCFYIIQPTGRNIIINKCSSSSEFVLCIIIIIIIIINFIIIIIIAIIITVSCSSRKKNVISGQCM